MELAHTFGYFAYMITIAELNKATPKDWPIMPIMLC